MPPAKTKRPNTRGRIPRPRLFRLLDQGRDWPVTWVQAPPGSGKTSLVSGFLRARRLRCLWYQVDESDADLASLFCYLGQAAPRRTPSRRMSITAQLPTPISFARRWELRGNLSRAVDCFHRAVDVPACSQAWCRVLMQACRHRGRRDEAAARVAIAGRREG